jgi:hypothetical protein
LRRLNTNDMSIKFIIITTLECLLVIFLIVGLICEKKLIKYEMQIHNRLKELVKNCREILDQLHSNH